MQEPRRPPPRAPSRVRVRVVAVPLTVALPRESRDGERRVALVPVAVSRLLARSGLAVRIEHDCGRSAGFHDEAYAGVSVAPDFAATVEGAEIVTKVGIPTLEEIACLAPGTLLLTLTQAFLHLDEIAALADRGVTTVAMDLVPRTARARSMDALSSQAMVAGYKAALLAAELSPRLFPMLTTAAGTIRPSRVVVIGAGVAGLQAIATARRLGAEVEAYDIRGSARERIESLGARMIDTGVEGADAAGHARALRRDELAHQHDVLAARLSRAHAVICAASIPGRPAPLIVTTDMVEGMLPDTVIVDMASTTGGNCELTRPGEQVRHGETLIAGPIDLASRGAVHASEMYARNVSNLLELILGEETTLTLDEDDDIVARCVLTHAGEIRHGAIAESMGRTARPFGPDQGGEPTDEEPSDTESGWASEAPRPRSGTRTGAGAIGIVASGTVTDMANDDGADETSGTRPDERSRSGVPIDGASVDPEAKAADASASGGTGESPRDDAGADDLTVIDGIGPALQGRLYAFGVTRLEMLADLDEPGRQRLAVQLELDDEIERTDWIGQARALLAIGGRGEGSESG